uniref:Uncharacterized protein n=1 Tax=Brassica oleracea TaxID=3712 RepID=A0A3P6F0X9_BRAOL|nr:unnamed protein product [Brassica oleracea]
MASSYSEKPQEEEETFEDHIEDQPYVKPPPFDIAYSHQIRERSYTSFRENERVLGQANKTPSTNGPDTPY